MEPAFQRARQPEQKAQRRAHLLATARALLEGGADLHDLSLNELARQAGMAKANVYRYFESREALLLALLWDAWSSWYASFGASPNRRRRVVPPERVVSDLARSLSREHLLCSLTAALPTVLEQNLGEETLHRFKTDSLAFFGEVARHLEDRCSALPSAAWAELLRDAAHVIMGLYPASHPAPAVSKVLSDPALAFFRLSFAEELERFLLALAAQRLARRGQAPSPAGA